MGETANEIPRLREARRLAQAGGTLRGRGPRYVLKKPVESNGRSRIPVLSLLQRARRGSRPQSGHKGVQSGQQGGGGSGCSEQQPTTIFLRPRPRPLCDSRPSYACLGRAGLIEKTFEARPDISAGNSASSTFAANPAIVNGLFNTRFSEGSSGVAPTYPVI